MKKEPKILNVMRISAILLSLCVFSSFASKTSSQNVKVNMSGKNMTIANFIDQIEQQTDYLFVYSKNEVDVNKTIPVKAGSKSVAQYLNDAFADSEVKFAFENDYIVLTKNSLLSIKQQGKKVTGSVTDSSGEPVIGANVVVKGTTNGTITDVDGKFSLEIPDKAVLVISYIGYLTREVSVNGQSTVSAVLTVRIQQVHLTGNMTDADRPLIADRGSFAVFLSPFGCDHNNSVGTTCTVDGSSRSVFQHFHGFDIIRVNQSEVFHHDTVHYI